MQPIQKRKGLTDQTNYPKIISLFCGAGGLDLGFKQAGFEVALAIDFSSASIETHQKNFPETKSFAGDLTKLGTEGVLNYVLQYVPLGSRLGIIGGPPCQGFSRSNPKADPDDPRNSLPSLYVDIIQSLQCHYNIEFIVFENVLGMKDSKHAEKYNSLISGLTNIGFTINEQELCALDYGVPQVRNRVIISGMRNDKGYSKIKPIKRSGLKTVREAIGSLCEPVFFERHLEPSKFPVHPNHWTMKPKSKKFTSGIPAGSKTRSFRKLSWNKASPTIAFGNREIHIHPQGTRRLSIYEAMLLQGFPSSFELKGNLSEQVTQISNAVPPPLAKSIALALKKSLAGK